MVLFLFWFGSDWNQDRVSSAVYKLCCLYCCRRYYDQNKTISYYLYIFIEDILIELQLSYHILFVLVGIIKHWSIELFELISVYYLWQQTFYFQTTYKLLFMKQKFNFNNTLYWQNVFLLFLLNYYYHCYYCFRHLTTSL